jgi:uncharacterized protein (TIGR03435 family)
MNSWTGLVAPAVLPPVLSKRTQNTGGEDRRRYQPKLWLIGISVAAFAQSPATPVFDAASVKAATPTAGLPSRPKVSGGPGSSDPGRIDYQNITLGSLVQGAYNLPFYRLSAPAWFNTERYDINATIPGGSTEEQFRQMLQNLLAGRFKLAAHREAKEIPVYQLTVAKGGPKFKAWSAEDERKLAEAAADRAPRSVRPDADGYPVLPAGQAFSMLNGHARFRGERELMPNFAEVMSGMGMDRPILDATGLKGQYGFTLSWVFRIPGAPAPADIDTAPDLFAALQEQLGLKLEPARAPMELLVVDHAEKTPVQN